MRRSGLRHPNMESPLYQRRFPGQGQRGGSGMYGLGQSGETDTEGGGLFTTQVTDYSSGEGDGVDTGGSLYAQLIAAGVDPVDAEAYLVTGQLPGGSTGATTVPGKILTDAELKAEQTAAHAWMLQNVPGISAAVAGTLALTAAQIATGIANGTVQKTATCPSGYQFVTGICVPDSGQWFSFATNKQILTWGGVVIAALVIVNLIPSGGGRRRR